MFTPQIFTFIHSSKIIPSPNGHTHTKSICSFSKMQLSVEHFMFKFCICRMVTQPNYNLLIIFFPSAFSFPSCLRFCVFFLFLFFVNCLPFSFDLCLHNFFCFSHIIISSHTQFNFQKPIINLVPIGLSRVQVVPAKTTPKFQTKLGETQIIRTTGQKNNNNKSLGTATITTTTTSPGGHIVKGKQKKFNILLEHNYA